jgi:putative methionine-R-sulfoxide reductase with GAF domain/CHASE3 domain sensor protein
MLSTLINRLRISTRLLFGFGVITLLVGVLGVAALQDVLALSSLANRLADHPLRVIDESQQALNEMALIQRDVLAIVGRGDLDREALAREIGELDQRIDTRLQVVRTQYLGPSEDVVGATRAVEEWRRLRTRTLSLYQAGEYFEIDQMLEQRARIAAEAEQSVQRILHHARNNAAEFRQAAESKKAGSILRLSLAMGVFIVTGVLISLVLTRSITGPLEHLRARMLALADGDLEVEIPYREDETELGAIARGVQVVKEAALSIEARRWVKSTLAELGAVLQQAGTPQEMARSAISALVPRIGASVGVFWLWEEDAGLLVPAGSYGQSEGRFPLTRLRPGQGLAGECALQRTRIVLDQVPEDYACIVSGTGEAAPRSVVIEPVVSKGKLLGVVEIGSFHPLDDQQHALLEELLPILGLNLEILARGARSAA